MCFLERIHLPMFFIIIIIILVAICIGTKSWVIKNVMHWGKTGHLSKLFPSFSPFHKFDHKLICVNGHF